MEIESQETKQKNTDTQIEGENASSTPGSESPIKHLTRPGRFLLGWMHPEIAHLVSGRADDPALLEQDRARIEAARKIVASRPDGIDQQDLVEPMPPELDAHVAALQLTSAAAFFSEGWNVAIVDLARICAFQPVVHTEDAMERTSVVTDLITAATITLPLPQDNGNLPVTYDENQKTLTAVSRNPNLRVRGLFCGPVNGQTLLGFHVEISPSFLQVVQYQERYYLRDGYHRAYGLLRRGVRRVPAFVRQIDTFEQLGIQPGMLPHDAVFGERPPMLQDFLNDEVSGECMRPVHVKALTIHALELNLPA
jgi:hypothetical protein